jgi:hypothetical protein
MVKTFDGFEYVRMHGIFRDDLLVYREDAVKGGVRPDQWGGVKVDHWIARKLLDMRGVWRLERSGRRHTPRRVSRRVVGLLGRRSGVGGTALVPALLEAIAVAVHLQDVNVVGEAAEQGSGKTLGAKDLGPLLEGRLKGSSRCSGPRSRLEQHRHSRTAGW